MSSVLSYEVFTDPNPLVSQPGEPAVGTVNIVVSNYHDSWVKWKFIEVEVPVGDQGGDLTTDFAAITPEIREIDPFYEQPTLTSDSTSGTVTAEYRQGGLRQPIDFEPGMSMILVLKDVPVPAESGLVRLQIKELASGGDTRATERTRRHAIWLQKKYPAVPYNFRPEASMVDPGSQVRLLWNGPDDLDYRIVLPDGTEEPGQVLAPGSYEWRPGSAASAPKRDATYTLVAEARTGQQQGYFLTTGVQVRNPEFETITAAQANLTALTADQAEVTGQLTAADAEVTQLTAGQAAVTGQLTAADAEVTQLTAGQAAVTGQLTATNADVTQLVAGQAQISGQLSAGDTNLTALTAGQAAVTGQLTAANADVTQLVAGQAQVSGQLSAGDTNLTALTTGQAQVTGQLTAASADLADLTTGQAQVTGRLTTAELDVDRLVTGQAEVTGQLTAAGADLADLTAGQAQVTGRLTAQGGLTVSDSAGNPLLETDESSPRLVVYAGLDAEGDLHANGNVRVSGNMSVDSNIKLSKDVRVAGKLSVTGDVGIKGQLNANGHLSVRRPGGDWVLKTSDEKVVVNAGTFHVMGMMSCRSREWEQHG